MVSDGQLMLVKVRFPISTWIIYDLVPGMAGISLTVVCVKNA